jgi:preprotein translocase subunit SecG
MLLILKIILVLDAIVLFPAVLLQAGQGGGLATQFGGTSSTDSFVGGRQAATWLTKTTWWSGGIFLFLCFVLSLASSRTGAPRSLVEEQLRQQQQQEAPAPLQPLPLNQTTPAPAAPGAAPTTPQGQGAQPAPAPAQQPPAGSTKRP